MNSKKLSLKNIFCIFLAIFIIMVICTIINCIALSKYEKVEAEVTNISSRVTGKKHKNVKYEELKYEYKGHVYTVKQDVSFLENNDVGDKVIVKVNPENPSAISDVKRTRFLYVADGMFLILCVIIGIKMRK